MHQRPFKDLLIPLLIKCPVIFCTAFIDPLCLFKNGNQVPFSLKMTSLASPESWFLHFRVPLCQHCNYITVRSNESPIIYILSLSSPIFIYWLFLRETTHDGMLLKQMQVTEQLLAYVQLIIIVLYSHRSSKGLIPLFRSEITGKIEFSSGSMSCLQPTYTWISNKALKLRTIVPLPRIKICITSHSCTSLTETSGFLRG